MIRVILFGQKSFAAAVLDRLCTLPDVTVAAVCAPPNPDDALVRTAQRLMVPVLQEADLSLGDWPQAVDLGVCAHWHGYVNAEMRANTRLGFIGYHPSLLPIHRGKDAIRWTIRFHEPVAGGTVYWLDDTADGGDVFLQDFCFVKPAWDASDLWRERLFPMGVDLLESAVAKTAAGDIRRIPQDHSLATWEPALNPIRLSGSRPTGQLPP